MTFCFKDSYPSIRFRLIRFFVLFRENENITRVQFVHGDRTILRACYTVRKRGN